MKRYEKINKCAERVAAKIFSTNNKDHLIINLIKWVEEKGNLKIEINFADNLEKNHSGLVYPDPVNEVYKIWINAKECWFRQKFTICHEIGHIIKNSNLKYECSDGDIYSEWGEERFCNRFAAAYLLPEEYFIKKWNNIIEPEFLKKARLASIFGVSGEVIYWRAKELNLLEK